MNANQRFRLNGHSHFTDRLDPSVECYWPGDFTDDETHLRGRVLWTRLNNLVGALIINTKPMEKLEGRRWQREQ